MNLLQCILGWYSDILYDVVYHSTDAAAADGGLKLAVELFHCAGGVKSLGQQNDPVQKEEGSDAVDDVLHELNSTKHK